MCLNLVADSDGTYYFNATDKVDQLEGLGSTHELQFAPSEWVEALWEIPDDADPIEVDQFLNKIKTDQLVQGSGTFNSFVFAAQ